MTTARTVTLALGRQLRIGPGQADDELIGGLAVDDRHIYATFFHADVADPHRPGPGELVVIDRASFQPVARIRVGNEPRRVTLSRQAGRVFVLNRGPESFSVSIVDIATLTELTQVSLGQGTVDVAVHERSEQVYVTNVDPQRESVQVLDAASGALVDEIVVGPGPIGISVEQRSHLVSVAISSQSAAARINQVVVIDGGTATVVDRVDLGSGPVQPSVTFLNPVTGLVHVGTLGGSTVPTNVIVVSRDGAGFVDSVVRTAAGVASAVADIQAGLLYVAVGSRIQAIDLEDGQVVATLLVSRAPEGLAVDPRDGHVYAGDRFTGTVYEIVPMIARDEDPRAQATAPIGAVVLAGNRIDLFVTGDDGELRTARWTEDAPADDWTGWQSLTSGLPPGAPVAATRTGTEAIRVGTVNSDGNVMVRAFVGTAASFWRPLVSDVPPGAHVAMTSRQEGTWLLFTVGSDGLVFSAGEDVTGGIQTTTFDGMAFPPGAPVAAVSQHPDEWALFVLGGDGAVWTMSWASGAGVTPWRSLGGGFRGGTRIAATVRRHFLLDVLNPDRASIDLFAVGPEADLQTASSSDEGDWSEWVSLGSPEGGLVPGSVVGIVSRTEDQLDLVVVGGDGRVWTRWRPPFAADWSEWQDLSVRAAAPGAEIALVTAARERLDVFWVTRDGAMHTAWWQNPPAKWSSLQGIDRRIPTPRKRFREPITSEVSLVGHLIVDIWEDGSYATQGHIHNGGFDPYDYVQQGTLLGGDGMPAIASHQRGHLDGTLSEGPFGSPERNDDWADLGWNLMVFDRWDDLQAGQLDMHIAYENVGLGGILEDIGATLLGLVADPLSAAQRLAPLFMFGSGVGGVVEALARKFGVRDGLLLDGALAFVVGPSALIPIALEVAGVVRDRDLSNAERALARRVFGDSLPFDRIRVTSLKGFGNHPFVMPTTEGAILINMGPEAFDDLAGDVDSADGKPGQTFIHELVHVWQIEHDPFVTGWVTSGVLTQLKVFGTKPYNYDYPNSSGRRWRQFGIEQQAELVEEWYQRHWPDLEGFAAITDPYFRFIRDHIRLNRR